MSENSAPEDVVGLVPRSLVGGVLMGLANLVPGISGGTMLLAAGVYPRFIESIADLTRLRFKKTSLMVLALIVGAAGVSILLFAGPVKSLVVHYRWVMYSIFIGLTLGGVPVVWGLAKPPSNKTWFGAALGFVMMALIAVAQTQKAGGGSSDGILMMLIAGVAGASAMILPGISGGYLLLVLGVYVPILAAIDAFKNALKAGDINAAMDPTLSVVLPVGIGVVIGVVGVSNVLKVLLEKQKDMTLGALLGFLVGAVIGLWPFQQGVKPAIGDLYRGQPLTAESLAKLSPEKYPTEFFTPSVMQVLGAIGLVVAGFAVTAMIARFGKGKKK